jgi:SAM-dependent methyltransferase
VNAGRALNKRRTQDKGILMSGDNAQSYYTANALKHGTPGDIARIVTLGKLPADPSEVDWAIYWMLKQPTPHLRCLDIGCSQLTLLRSVAHIFETCYGIDITPYSNWDDHPDIQTSVVNLDEQDLPFGDNYFDAVTMLMVLEHVFNPFHALREMRRICRLDGRMIIGVPNLGGIRFRLELLRGKLPITSSPRSFLEEAWDGYHLHNFTLKSLEWLLLREGLRPLEWASQGKLQFLKRWNPGFFGSDLVVVCEKVEPNLTLIPKF